MSFRIKPSLLAVTSALAALSALGSSAALADTTLAPVEVTARSERADGPVAGYNATRSATFTKTDTPLKEVPATLTIVGEELIEDLGMRSMSDVVRYVPGVTAAQGEGNRDQLVIRGNNTTADFYVDGVRDDGQTFRDPYNVERIEILKGPAGMIFGRGGAGGVINRVTKKPVSGRVAEAELTAGSHNQRRASVDFGNSFSGTAAWRVNGMAEQADSFRNGVELKRFAVNPSVTLAPSAQTAITLSLEHADDERTADRGIPSQNGKPFSTDPSTFFGNAEQSESKITVDSFAATVDHDFGDGTQLKNSFRATKYDKYYQNVYPNSAVTVQTSGSLAGVPSLAIAAYNNSNERTNVFNQTDVTTHFKTAGIDHTLLVGIELGHQDSANRRMTGTVTPSRVRASDPFAVASNFATTGTDANNRVKAAIASAYVQDQIALSPSWKVIGGVRYDHFKVDFDDQRTPSASVTPRDLSRTDTGVSPRLGVIWAPAPAYALYASYSYAFLPSGEQLSLTPTTADLEPEEGKNYEVGGRFDLAPKLTLTTAAFRLDRNDVRVADPANPGFFVKTGQTRTEGWEVGLQGDITPNWQVFGGYARLNAEITKTTDQGPAGRKLPLVPGDTASLWNKVGLGGGWSVGLGVIHQTASYASISNTVALPAFTRVDGAIYYAFADGNTRLALNVENLSDREYYPNAHSDNNITPDAPRNARLTLSTKF